MMSIDDKSVEAHVLVVDDDPTTRMLVRESLRTGGFEVHEAGDGEEGLAAFHEVSPDLILMDVVMPKMDGFELCHTIRSLPQGDRVPILMATSLEDLNSINRAYEAGATDFVTKPMNWSLLAHRIRYMIRSGRTNQKLQLSQTRNQALLDAIPDVMCRVSRSGQFLELRASQEMHLIPADREVQSMHLSDVLPPEVAEALTEAMEAALATKKTQELEFMLPGEEGELFYEARVVVSGTDEVLAIVRDITPRKTMEQQLRHSENRFRSLIENASDLVTIAGVDGVIRYGSPAVERLLRIPAAELVGTKLSDWIHPDDEPLLRNNIALAAAQPGSPHANQIRLKTRENGVLVTETICAAFRDEISEEDLIVVNARDITDRLLAQQALQESEDQLRQSQKMEAVGRLAGGVAHDFNNLLTAILGYGQIVQERLESEGLPTEDVEEIRKAGTRASSLTRQLLTFSRKQVIQPQVLNLNTIGKDMEKMLRRLLGEDIALETRFDQDLKLVLADPGQVEQVVMNLAVNARDAMPGGGVLVVETNNVTIDETYAMLVSNIDPGEYVQLTVSDNGMGMDEDTRAKIFEPFFTTKESGQGTGLGLSTVYGIVKQSGGHIRVYSEVGEGTAFKIYLPLSKQDITPQEGTTSAPEDLRGDETVLLAEDEAWVRSLVRQCLERSGYTVLEANNGEDAMRIHQHYKGPIHLLLTDVVMPRMNGVELAERIASLRPDTRILYMSGYTDHAILRHGRLAPGNRFLQKPFTITDLASRVRTILDAPELQAEVG